MVLHCILTRGLLTQNNNETHHLDYFAEYATDMFKHILHKEKNGWKVSDVQLLRISSFAKLLHRCTTPLSKFANHKLYYTVKLDKHIVMCLLSMGANYM